MTRTSSLHALAERVGIIPEYVDQTGTETRVTSDETRVALLAAMGIDASSDDAAARAHDELESAESDRLLAPVRVVRHGTDVSPLELRLPRDWTGKLEWEVRMQDESARTVAVEGSSQGRELICRLPQHRPAAGYYTVDVAVRRGGEERRATQSLIIVPQHCPRPRDILGSRRVFGLIANLYTVRAPHDFGAGDLTTLGELLEWTAELGGEFVGVNPLHALRNRGHDVSPYSPVSRLYRNPLYIDAQAVPEFAESIEARNMMGWLTTRAELSELQASSRVEYARVMRLKRLLLEALHRTFVSRHRDADTERGRAYRDWLDTQDETLTRFATWAALEDHFARDTDAIVPWDRWPEAYRDPRSPEVAIFREANREQVDFHRWLQFELDRQLGAAAERGKRAGLAIGLYQDLAIGSSPNGADSWLFRELFVQDVSIGAPPDLYSATGQNWGLPPIDPRLLREDAYRYWISLVRSSLRHAGALRIDHVMGLFRQFWIPNGMSGEHGAYVRFPAADLLGILALEATRAGAIVVGEDLGTVPPEVPPGMREWGLLSSDVLYFERDRTGGFKGAHEYDEDALTTANTHDMPTLTGWWKGSDIDVRRRVGLIAGEEDEARARAERERERHALLDRLAAEGIVPSAEQPITSSELRQSVHRLLCRTHAELVGLSLDDVAGEADPVNVPGVGAEQYPSWTRRLTMSLPELRSSPEVARVASCEERRTTR